MNGKKLTDQMQHYMNFSSEKLSCYSLSVNVKKSNVAEHNTWGHSGL